MLRTLARALRAARFFQPWPRHGARKKAADAAALLSAGTSHRRPVYYSAILLRVVRAKAGPGTPAPRDVRQLSPVDTPRHNLAKAALLC